MAFFAPVQRRNPLHVPTHTPEPHRPATAPPWPSRSLPAHYLPGHPRPTVPPGRGAQSRPRLAPGLNGPVLTAPPALGIARPGAASRPVLVLFHMTGFDGFLRIVGRWSGRQWPGGAFKWSNKRWLVALGQLLGQLPNFSGNLQAMARLSGWNLNPATPTIDCKSLVLKRAGLFCFVQCKTWDRGQHD